MSDLISREETYKILCEEYQLLQKEYLKRVIDKVPSAEPERLKCKWILDEEMVALSPKEAAEYAIRHMAQKFADGIAQFMDVRIMDMPLTNKVVFESRLRVIDSGYRFGMSGCGADMRGKEE